MNPVFSTTAGNKINLNSFDLSHANIMTGGLGTLYPVCCEEAISGDVWKIQSAIHIESQDPLLAPLLTDIDAYVHYFCVPMRLLYGSLATGDNTYEAWLTGVTKDPNTGLPSTTEYTTPLPSWTPNWSATGYSSKKIWDYIGNPVRFASNTWSPVIPNGLSVSSAPQRAYNLIFNTWYRDSDLTPVVDIATNEDLLSCCYSADYFTSALERQTRFDAPALPLSGKLPVQFFNSVSTLTGVENSVASASPIGSQSATSTTHSGALTLVNSGGADSSVANLYVDLSNSGTFKISDLRLAIATQALEELSMRSGSRFVDFLNSQYGCAPNDSTLDRPEYIGGTRLPINVSPVVQTSETGSTPQGHRTGILNGGDSDFIGTYRVLEPSVIVGILSLRVKPIYHQGIRRNWLRQNRYEVYNPAFANLSEQGIYNCEVMATGTAPNGSTGDKDIFGYIGHWDELRTVPNRVCGACHNPLTAGVYAGFRNFANLPALNNNFVSMNHGTEYNRLFSGNGLDDPFVIAFSNIIDCYRNLPKVSVPSLSGYGVSWS